MCHHGSFLFVSCYWFADNLNQTEIGFWSFGPDSAIGLWRHSHGLEQTETSEGLNQMR